VTDASTGEGDWLESLQALARDLRNAPSGYALYEQLQRLLEEWRAGRADIDSRFAIQFSFFLGSLSEKGIDVDVAKVTRQLMETSSRGINQPTAAGDDWLGAMVAAMRKAPPAASAAPRTEPRTEPQTEPEPGESAETLMARPVPSVDTEDEEDDGQPTYPEVERRVNSAYRLHLDRKHGEIEKLQGLLAQKATEAMAQNKEFGALLQIERSALQQASSINEIQDLKDILIGGTDELIEGQRNLSDKLKSSFEYLQIIKSDSERLHEELNKVRLLSLTDEYTGLPNRRAFMRRLEDEIARAQRYDTPLALALIDLDNFKEINDKYGHPAGDAVLAWYAQHALPTFRHYDMVARYGGEEFAVLFPSTTSEGAHRALEKMRERITGATVEYDGTEIEVPSFSAGITTYFEYDDEQELIKRADTALYQAKSAGRGRTEMELPKVGNQQS
jgi:diguanylate cyclase